MPGLHEIRKIRLFDVSYHTQLLLAGLLAENIVHRDAVMECKGLPAVMEYATVRARIM